VAQVSTKCHLEKREEKSEFHSDKLKKAPRQSA
jgi:hypothetical protein